MSEVHIGTLGGPNDTTTYAYNGDDELTSQTDSYSASTTTTNFTYDLNGSLTTSTMGSNVTSYGYDVQNRLVSYSSGSTDATYVYDDDGDRVAETVDGVTSLYLTDTNNPTGYSQPIEVKSSMTAAPSETYELGDVVLAQADSSGNVEILLQDGHGSTRFLVDNTQFHNVIAMYNYDAFGDAIGFNPATAATPWLFGGDGIYDPASGLVFHSNGRPSEASDDLFITADPLGYSQNQDPVTLNKYLYANANPVGVTDPSGHDGDEDEELVSDGIASGLDGEGDDAANLVEQEADDVVDEGELFTELGDDSAEDYANTELTGRSYPDEALGLGPYDPSYNPGQLVWDHNPARAIADLLGTDSEETQLLESLMNSRKGFLESELVSDIQSYLAAGMSPEKILEAVGPTLESIAKGGFELPVDPFLLDGLEE